VTVGPGGDRGGDRLRLVLGGVVAGRAAFDGLQRDWGTAIAQDASQSPVGTGLGKPGPTPR
jgi:hypothetical protein